MRRVKFRKGKQRKFLEKVARNLLCSSIRGILQFGFDIPYSTLKNYYTQRRLMDEEFVRDLCFLAKIEFSNLDVEFLEDNWGQIKGGRKSRRVNYCF